VSVTKERGVFVVSVPRLERIVAGTDMSLPEAKGYLRRQLERMGVNTILRREGAKPGDRVRLGELEWEFEA
jgi:GTP-binding protein